MPSTVYLLRFTDWKDLAAASRCFQRLLGETPLLDGVRAHDRVAVKLTFGEAGNTGHPPAALVRDLVTALHRRDARPFLTETNTLYNGRRRNSLDHLEVAREHGFTHETIGAPIILGDGLLGREVFDVPIRGKIVKVAHLVPTVRDAHSLVGLAHLTGHLLCGFGGAIKNIGMGLANRAGKLEMHSGVSPVVSAEKCTLCLTCVEACAAGAITPGTQAVAIDAGLCTGCAECLAVCPSGAVGIDWSSNSAHVQESLAEYAGAVVQSFAGRTIFITLLNHVSTHCDCMGPTPDCISPDVGMAAATDPVALDQACVDLVIQAAGHDPFRRAWPEVDWGVQLRHAERAGVGQRAYEIAEVAP